MKAGITAFLILLTAAFAWPQAATIASRRYAEKTPLQYSFGPLTAVAPYNSQPGHTTAVTSQLQPPSLVQSDNTFTSTSNFSVLEQTSPSTSFSVASNVGTITSTANTVYLLGDPATSFSIPSVFVQVEVTSNGASTSEFGLALSNASGSTYLMADMYHASECNLVVYTGGSYMNLNIASCSLPSAPWEMGLSLVGNDACFWLNSGSGWLNEGCASAASYYNFETSGHLSGFESAIRVVSSSSTPWETSDFITGTFGGIGVRDISLVTYPDGRPYMQGSVAYFTASSCDPSDSCDDAVFTFDVSSSVLTQIGVIMNIRGSAVVPDVASDLVFDPANGIYRYMVGGWGTSSSPATWYGSWSTSSANILSGGDFAVTAATQMTWSNCPSTGSCWDAHFVCSAWNYSSSTCSRWISSAYSSGYAPTLQYTTSDPSADSWTAIASGTAALYEGERFLRTATGSGGTSLYEIDSGISGTESRYSEIRNISAFTLLGYMSAPIPAGGRNAPHAQLFSFGNTEYYVTFSDVQWGVVLNTMGDWLVGTAPKYSAQTNWPTLSQEGSSFSSSSSVSSESLSTVVSATGGNTSLSVTSGQLIVGACRGADDTETSVTVTDSRGNTLTTMPLNINGAGFTVGFYGFVTTAGTDTITCTLGAASTYVGVTAEIFNAGFLTSVDYTGTANQSTASGNFTSTSFSTTAKGLIVVCPDFLGGAGTFQPGFIGPYAAAFGAGLSSGATMCEGTTTPAAQSSIEATANVGQAGSAKWGAVVMSFK